MLVLASPLGRASALLSAHAAIDGLGGCPGVALVRDGAWRRIGVDRRGATREQRRCAVEMTWSVSLAALWYRAWSPGVCCARGAAGYGVRDATVAR